MPLNYSVYIHFLSNFLNADTRCLAGSNLAILKNGRHVLDENRIMIKLVRGCSQDLKLLTQSAGYLLTATTPGIPTAIKRYD